MTWRSKRTGRASVHPRGCGEHNCLERAGVNTSGSSPRVRGTRCGFSASIQPDRFIPAGAGNTDSSVSAALQQSVHPRGCGEHPMHSGRNAALAGSSPRVRGTLVLGLVSALGHRFIPAGAGNTNSPSEPNRRFAVHPRGCGEHAVSYSPSSRTAGSSPRVRGTPRTGPIGRIGYRFIPAGAGNTHYVRMDS